MQCVLQRNGTAGPTDARGAFFNFAAFPAQTLRRYASAFARFIGCSTCHFSTISIAGGACVDVRGVKPTELRCSASQAGEMIQIRRRNNCVILALVPAHETYIIAPSLCCQQSVSSAPHCPHPPPPPPRLYHMVEQILSVCGDKMSIMLLSIWQKACFFRSPKSQTHTHTRTQSVVHALFKHVYVAFC